MLDVRYPLKRSCSAMLPFTLMTILMQQTLSSFQVTKREWIKSHCYWIFVWQETLSCAISFSCLFGIEGIINHPALFVPALFLHAFFVCFVWFFVSILFLLSIISLSLVLYYEFVVHLWLLSGTTFCTAYSYVHSDSLSPHKCGKLDVK